MASLQEELISIEPGLRDVLICIADGVEKVAATLRSASTTESGTSNLLGDKQLVADIEADECILEALKACAAVELASSEEQPIDIELTGEGYSVAYDPLDGSSIIGADWAVGSIFAIFPKKGFINRSGKDMIAAAYAVYGPRTLLIVARPISSLDTNNQSSDTCTVSPDHFVVQEFLLLHKNDTDSPCWILQQDAITIPESKKIFAPANVRATKGNEPYAEMMSYWMEEQYTLRYSGGLVPDVHHILAKGGGVFCNPSSDQAPAKLRTLYEVFPLSFIVEASGGASYCGDTVGMSALNIVLKGHDDRNVVCLGSKNEVMKCKKCFL